MDNRFIGGRTWLRSSMLLQRPSMRLIAALTAVAALLLGLLRIPGAGMAEQSTAERLGDVPARSDIFVERQEDNAQAPRLTTAARNRIAALPGVESTIADLQVPLFGGGDTGWGGQIVAVRPELLPPGIDRGRATSLGPTQVIAPDAVDGTQFTEWVGKQVPIDPTGGEPASEAEEPAQIEIAGTYDRAWDGYGPESFLGPEQLVIQLAANNEKTTVQKFVDVDGLPGLYVRVPDRGRVDEVAQAIEGMGFSVTVHPDDLGGLPTAAGMIGWLWPLLAVLSVVALAFAVHRAVAGASAQQPPTFLRLGGTTVADSRGLALLDSVVASVQGALPGAIVGVVAGLAWLNGLVPGSSQLVVRYKNQLIAAAVWSIVGLVLGALVVSLVSAIISIRGRNRGRAGATPAAPADQSSPPDRSSPPDQTSPSA